MSKAGEINKEDRRRFRNTILIVLCAFMLTGFGCRRTTESTDKIEQEITVWGLWQESNQIKPILSSFEDQTGIKVKYKKIANVASYEQELLSALAEGRGPDVFVVHHTWIDDKRGIMTPASSDIIDVRAVDEEFVDVVSKDLIREGQVWALPTSVDTLALYFNRDLLNAAGVARPPASWTDFQQMVERIAKVNQFGAIQQSAAALGTAANINRAGDIVQLLFLQSGLPIVDTERGKVDIDNETAERGLVFYTDFSNRIKKVFTWDLNQDFSIDAFAEGETATMLNYSYHIPTIRAKNPRLNFGIAKAPQIAGSSEENHVSFAAYWPFAVSNSSPAPTASWRFIRYLTNAENSKALNVAQGTPPARHDTVLELQRDPELGVFADQSLTATSWPRADITKTDAIFNQLIDSVVTGAATPRDALERAEDQLKQLTEKEDS